MKRLFVFVVLTVFAGISVFGQMIDMQPVATVRLTRSEPITVRQLRIDCERHLWQLWVNTQGRAPTNAELAEAVRNLSVADRRQVLEMMINERLLLQAAERDRIGVTENELNQHMTQLRSQMAQAAGRQRPFTEEEFAQVVRQQTGMDMPAFREVTRRQIIAQRYIMNWNNGEINNVEPPTEADIVNEFNLTRRQWVRPDTVRVSMISVPYGPDAASRANARRTIERLNAEIDRDPSRFAEAVLRGQAPGADFMAGDAGFLPMEQQSRQQLGAEFMEAAAALRQGEVSGIIEARIGYQIIMITESYPMRMLELDDIAMLPDSQLLQLIQDGRGITMREYIRVGLHNQRQQEALIRVQTALITELRTTGSFQITEANLTGW